MSDCGGAAEILVATADESFAAEVAESFEATDRPVRATPVGSAAEAAGHADHIDGAVVGGRLPEPRRLVRRLSEAGERPVVFLSGETTAATELEAVLEAGAIDVFPRAVADARCEPAVERLLEDREGTGDDGTYEQAYEALFENIAGGLVVHDAASGEIVDVNDQFCEMNGYERSELLGEPIGVVTPPGETHGDEAAREMIQRAREEGPQRFEWRNQRSDGETFPVEVHLAVVELDGLERVLASVRDITERKRREREYQQIFDGVPDPLTVNDPETGEMIDVNEAMCETLGYDRETILEKGTEGLSVTEDGYSAERAKERIDRVMETGEPETFEWKLETADGSHRVLEVTGKPAVINGQRRYISLTRDVTERKKREREYEQIFNSVNDAIVVFDPEGGELLNVNDAYHELFGYDDLGTIQRLGIDGLSANDEGFTAERAWELIREVSETGESKTVEWLAETSDGERRWLEATLAPAAIGGQERVLSIQRDVTERRELEQTYRDLFEGVSDGLVVHDPATGEILEVNERYCTLTGYDREELLEESISLIVPEDSEHSYADAIDRITEARRGGPQLFEFQGQRKNGTTFDAEIHLRTVELRGQERVLASVRDVTERKRREREFEQVFNSVNDAIAIHDGDTGALRDVNRRLCELTGYEKETIMELGAEGILSEHPDQEYGPDEVPEIIERVVGGEDVAPYEQALETSDGDVVWVEVNPTRAVIGGEECFVAISRDITERRRRQREYEQIFNGVNDAIVIQDPETAEPVDANETFLDRLGYDSVAEIREQGHDGLSVTSTGHTRERAQELCRRVMETGTPEVVEWEQRTSDGERRWIEATVDSAVIRGEDRILSMQRDITERKRRQRAIEALQAATERLQTAEKPESVARTAVTAARELFELPMVICWFHDEAAGRLDPVAATEPAREAGFDAGLGPAQYEYDVFQAGRVTEYTPTDGAGDAVGTGVLLPLGDHGLIAAGTDGEARVDDTVIDVAQALADHVTTALDRVKRAQEVRERERRFRLIADRIEEVIYLAEPDFSEVLYVNPAYESIWGRSVEDLYGDPDEFLEAVDPRDSDRVLRRFDAMLEEMSEGDPDDGYRFEYRIRKPGGEVRWIEANGYAVELPGEKRRFVGIADDITERKRREQRLEVFNRILRHNLRNRLDVIRSHAEVLADAETGDHADHVLAAVDDLAAIGSRARRVDQLMAGDDATTELDIAELLRETVAAIDAGDGAPEVTTEIPPSAPVTTNADALRSAVESALENAVEHAASTVAVSVWDRSDSYVISVDDDGPGIPREELAPIEAGTETSLQHSRGLGLWQLRWSVDTFSGDLSFETADGTTVRITVPDQAATSESE